MSVMRFSRGLLVGVLLMYFLDPAHGQRRRARVAAVARQARRRERALVGKAVRDVGHRAHGLGERARHPLADEVAEGVLHGRVRAALGRVVGRPRAIEVEVHSGAIVLRGPIEPHEADEALRCVRRIAGVHAVIDHLERRADVAPRAQPAPHDHWRPAMRLGAIGAGTLLAVWGLGFRRGILGRAIGVAGGGLALRGALDRPLGATSIEVDKTIAVHAPIERVFDLWSRLDNFPRFMDHVRDVEILGSRSLWKVDGPAGRVFEFTSEITRFEPDRVIAWRTLPDQAVEHEGTVRFEQVADGTRIHVHLTYRAPAGVIGHALASLLGWDPKARMDDDLARMKALLEHGRTRAHGERVRLDDLH